MYQVSEAYREAMHRKVQTFRLTGTAGNKAFTDANILKGSFSITNQCSGSDAVEIGQVYIGELNATFMDMGISRYQWQALEISPSLGLKLADGSYEDIPLGIFTVAEAEWTASGIVVKAYDNMARFDKNYGGGNAKGKPYVLLQNACSRCQVPLGMTRAQVEALPNGTETLSVYSTDNVETWRDFIGWLSQATGIMCAIVDKKLSSAVGFKGICKKVLILMLVGVANILDVHVVGQGSALRGAVIAFYLSNEGLSLLENAAYIGLPIPDKLREILEQLHNREDKTDKTDNE